MEYPYKLDQFFDALYEQDRHWGENLITSDPAVFSQVQQEKRAQLRQRLGIDKLERMAALLPPQQPEMLDQVKKEGCTIQQLGLTILPGLTMPAYVLTPDHPRLDQEGKPIGMLYCHGHGRGGIRDCFERKDPPAYHKYIPLTLAERGYTIFTFEPVAFGDFRVTDYSGTDTGCYPVTTRLLLHGITTVGLRIFQADAMAKYLRSQGIVRYGVAGISGGGTVTSMYAALNDQMSAVVISGYTNLFSHCVMAMHHCVDNFIPDVLQVGEIPYLIALAAPKPLYIASGLQDPIFPIEGTKEAIAILRDIYEKQGIGDRISQELFEGVHEFSENFIDWLDQTL